MSHPLITRALARATVVFVCILLAGLTHAQFPARTELVASGLVRPVQVLAPPGDHERLFVLQQYGRVKVIKNGQLLQESFLDLFLEVAKGGEQGTLGMAFDPDYANNGRLYVVYTDVLGDTVLERFSASTSNPDVVDYGSRQLLLGPVYQPDTKHNGASLAFGPDGMLYVGMGDGGGSYDSGPGHGPHGNAQSGFTMLGKLLRLDVNRPFPHIPLDNPWVGTPTVNDLVWALGLRMPWRFSFDRATGDLYLADVGEGDREEIDFVPAGSPGGLNFGWRCMEGSLCTGLSGCKCNATELTLPIVDYSRSRGCCVIGGYVYRGCDVPELDGWYLFYDLCGGLKAFQFDGSSVGTIVDLDALLDPPGGLDIKLVSGFGEDARGELYLCDLIDGEVFRIARTGPALPTTYCTAKLTSCGTAPSISSIGTSSAATSSGFRVVGGRARPDKLGVLLYTDGGRLDPPVPFSGGYLCLQGAVKRGPPTLTTPKPGNCKSLFALDMNAFAAGAAGGNPQAFLAVPGTQVNCQWWGRDTFAHGDYLSDAIEYRVCP